MPDNSLEVAKNLLAVADNPLAPAWLTRPEDANEFDAAIWPASARREADGVLSIAGVWMDALAEQFGTPLYVIDEQELRSRAERARLAFEKAASSVGTGITVYYAGKALLNASVARWVSEAGLSLDVCSEGELALALAAGVAPPRMALHGNNKSASEIERAVEAGIGTIVIDSEQEVARVAAAAARVGVRQRVRLRVNTGVHAHTHEFLATAHEDQKFGVVRELVPAIVADIRAWDSLDFVGLHCHIGSQIFDAAAFLESATRLIELHARLCETGPVPELNLGGGFGVAYTAADSPISIEAMATLLVTGVAEACSRVGIPIPQLAVEPGRYIVGPAGVTLYRLGTTKEVAVDSASRLYVSVDGGMSDNVRPALYGADYQVRLVSRTSEAAPVLVRVVGKHCESGDIVVNDDYLPGDIRPGDLLAVPVTGAYCWSLFSRYNYQPRPAIVAVLGGEARVIVRGETEADLLAYDVLL